jgi:hypothetical protein
MMSSRVSHFDLRYIQYDNPEENPVVHPCDTRKSEIRLVVSHNDGILLVRIKEKVMNESNSRRVNGASNPYLNSNPISLNSRSTVS